MRLHVRAALIDHSGYQFLQGLFPAAGFQIKFAQCRMSLAKTGIDLQRQFQVGFPFFEVIQFKITASDLGEDNRTFIKQGIGIQQNRQRDFQRVDDAQVSSKIIHSQGIINISFHGRGKIYAAFVVIRAKHHQVGSVACQRIYSLTVELVFLRILIFEVETALFNGIQLLVTSVVKAFGYSQNIFFRGIDR